MTSRHTSWFEAIESTVLLYPKLTATIAFNAMFAAARMIPTTTREDVEIRGDVETRGDLVKGPQADIAKAARLVSPANRSTRKRSIARKTSKKTTGRRRAA
jgi:hypothetical protein